MAICEALLQVFNSDAEVYWVAKGFFQFSEQIQCDIPKHSDNVVRLIEKEDNELYKYVNLLYYFIKFIFVLLTKVLSPDIYKQ